MIVSKARLSLQNIREGYMAEADFPKLTEACGKLSDAKFYVDDSPILSLKELRERARKLWKQHQIKMLILDSFQSLCPDSAPTNPTFEEQAAETSAALKALAEELGIVVMVVSTMKRKNRGSQRKLNLADLAQSGPDERYFDLVALLSEEDTQIHDIDDEQIGVPFVLNIAKQRNGPIGNVRLVYRKECACFEGCAPVTEADIPTAN
jgi:replicative DNA helicase